VDWSEAALAEAADRHATAVRWLCLDIENDNGAPLSADGYDLITLRFVVPFLTSRERTLQALGRRLRPGGTIVIITPRADGTPADRRRIALDENELTEVQTGWASTMRHDTEDMAFVILREPCHTERTPQECSPTVETQGTPTGARSTGPTAHATPHRHHFRLLGRYYKQVESGRKTIEVRVATREKAAVEAGDTIVFHDRDSGRELDIIVKRITSYASFEDLLSGEDPARIDPDGPPDDLLAGLRGIYPPAKEALGVLAFEFDHRPARPGRPMPMTPAQYAQTVPHHTVYGCLYVRDEYNRPVQLRSVYGSRFWQFPGGNTDAGEDPLETARRETAEETGLQLGQDQPRLLLTHYLRPGPYRPMGKIGFIFDGGTLTTEQLRQIRLDPAEHDLWAAHDLDEWQRLMGKAAFTRLEAVVRARAGSGPQYLVTGPA
jgi:ASC-1-like (ASCH) protein/8-oxo-dGTP pyrophosphatase MutT (NUDIX family)